MASNRTSQVVVQLQRMISAHDADSQADGQLLARFLARRDETAFAILVRRHGPMVLSVCRRILGNAADADDAFQAAFLVLIRKAATLTSRPVVGDWLHGVARRTALHAKRTAARRRTKERAMPRSEAQPAPARDDWLLLLDEELGRLPMKYQRAIVLCDLEGATREEAARRLGCPPGTLASRLARGRAMLARRLSRRGVALPAGAIAGLLVQQAAPASVPLALASAAVKNAALYVLGQSPVVGTMSAKVIALTEGVLKAMLLKKIMTAMMITVSLGLAAIACGALAVGQIGDKLPPGNIAQPSAEQTPVDSVPKTGLPKGAIVRLGSASFRHSGEVRRLTFTTDHRQLCAIGPLGVSRWNVQDGHVALNAMDRAKGYRHLTVISPDGKAAVELFNRDENAPEGTLYSVHVTDLTTGNPIGGFLATYEKGQPGPYSLHGAISPDGAILAVQYCAEVSLYSLPDGKLLRRLVDEDRVFRHVAFTPNGKQLVVGSLDKLMLTVWEVATGKFVKALHADGLGTGDLGVSRDGKLVVAACNRQEREAVGNGGTRSKDHAEIDFAIWELESAKLTRRITSDLPVHSLHVLPEGTVIGVVKPADPFARSALRKWRLADGKLLWSASADHRISLAAVSHDGSILATVAPEGIVRLWDTATGKARPLEGHATSIEHIAFAPDGKTVRTTDGIDVRTWDAMTGAAQAPPAPSPFHRWSAQWAAAGRIIAGIDKASDAPLAVTVHDAVAGKKLLSVTDPERENAAGSHSFAISADGARLAVPVTKNKVLHLQLWEVATAKRVWEVALPPDANVRNLVITADGRVLAGYTDLIALDAATGKQLARWDLVKSGVLPVDESNNTHLYPSRDGGTLGFVIQNVGIFLVDARTGKLVHRIDTAGEVHWPLVFNGDGTRFATTNAFGDTGIRIWETATGKLLRRLDGSPARVLAIDFSPDGRRLASGTEEGTALVWAIAASK